MPQTIDNMSVTWTNSLTTYTGIKLNAAGSSDANSAAGSLLMDLQVGSSSRFQVRKDGSFYAVPSGEARFGYVGSVNTLAVGSGGGIGFSSLSYVPTAAIDVLLTRRGTANLRLGAADAAAPVAQTLSVQSVVAGTTNTAGANLTITGSQGTGTGAGGSIVFQVAPAGSSGTAQNALATALTINADRNASFTGDVYVGNTSYIQLLSTGISVANSRDFTFSGTGAGRLIWATDTILARDAANTLALRNGANAQTFRVYNTYNGTNDEWGTFDFSTTANNLTIGSMKSGTGANRVVRFVAGGTRFAVSDGSYFQVDQDFYPLGNVFMAAKYTEMSEMTAPAAPAANKVRIYAEDNGSGKTRLMALFATGAAVQIAIEP